MNEQLGKYIEDYGGKHGPLIYIRDHVPGGTDIVPPMEIANLKDLSEQRTALELTRGVRAACDEVGALQFIARTSLKGFGDFRALVDALPTITGYPVHLLNNTNYLTGLAKTLMGRCEDPALIVFAGREGINFDPANVTVSFAPQLDYPHSTITEHPNQPERTMVDIHKPIFEGRREKNDQVTEAIDFRGDNMQNIPERFPWSSPFDTVIQLRRFIEEAGILDHDAMAYQYEGAARNDKPHWLLQIREFAPRRVANFEIDPSLDLNFEEQEWQIRQGYKPTMNRVMGITPEEGIILIHQNVQERTDAVIFEANNPSPYYLTLASPGATPKLTLIEQLLNIRGYSVPYKPYLSHQATRFAQVCLRGHGIVDLGYAPPSRHFEDGCTLRVICDGVKRVIERV